METSLSNINWHQRPNKREKIIFFITIFIFLFGFIKSCWQPSSGAIGTVKADIKTTQTERQTLQNLASNMSGDMESTINISKEEWELFDKMAKKIAAAPDAILMREFSSPAILRGVKLSEIKFDKKKDEGGIIKQKWSMTLIGSFLSIGSYVENIENLPILLIINNVNIHTLKESKVGHVSATIEGVAYGWK